MDRKAMIKNLKEIKMSIMMGAGGGVTDTAWITGSMSETIVDRIDGMLLELGCDSETLEIESQAWAAGEQPTIKTLLGRIESIEFDRHPIAGNVMAFLKLDDGEEVEVLRQGGIGIWACKYRPAMNSEEAKRFDDYLDREFRIQNEEGL